MNYICTWFCADEKGEESIFPQTGQKSSSASHQNIYWRCILVFFITSKRFNKEEKHLLFTNVSTVPVIDGIDVRKVLEELDVSIIHTSFKYKTPKGYYGRFQNQFYEFSILESIAENDMNLKDQYLVLDSDCIFLKPAAHLFKAAASQGFISFTDPVQPDFVINGLSRLDMKAIFEDLLGRKIDDIPEYHLGEFLLCSVANIKKIYSDFLELWPKLLERNAQQQPKFNEEAHTLSYLYYKNGLKESKSDKYMRRIWTNPLFYRDVRPSDTDLVIWHLPAEKTFGIAKLYQHFLEQSDNYGFNIPNDEYQTYVRHALGIPNLTVSLRTKYYLTSFYRKLKKSLKQVS
jgi:hypothetical protein